MTTLPRITEATPLHDRWIRLRFTDGLVQDVNLAPVFARGEIFHAIRDSDDVFGAVTVNDMGTVEWPGCIDLDPDVLYGRFEADAAEPLERRIIETAH